jgi:hypothetical protein
MNAIETLEKWKSRAKFIQDSHYQAAAILKRWHWWTGLPLVVVSTISGSNILLDGDYSLSVEAIMKVVAGLAGLLVAILAAVQTFMGFDKRSNLHYTAGVKYGVFKRKIEILATKSPKDEDITKFLTEMEDKWNSLTEESPPIPLRVWQSVYKRKKKNESSNAGKQK